MRLRPILYLGIEEASDRGIGLYLVGTLTEAMPLIFEAQILYSDTTSRSADTICSASPIGTRGSLAP